MPVWGELQERRCQRSHEPESGRLQAISRRSDNICRETAQLLSEGHVFGWFQGRSEFGPRALGSRSILADPRTAEMKDKLNKRVKHRQAFRPFAPIVLAERAKEIFEGDEESPFMLLAKGVRREWRDRNPGGRSRRRHGARADGSASHNERLHALLSEFASITGVPVLLNTSFNVKGEPIVETPDDAIKCFLTTGIDYLVLHDLLMAKKPFHKMLAPTIAAYSDIAAIVGLP